MKALDLFCGAGGASKGLENAGFKHIVGVDINKQPEYPYEFIRSDVFGLNMSYLRKFDFIWASPPCQAYSVASAMNRYRGVDYPDLMEDTRRLLKISGIPYVIENVPPAPMRRDLMLCGEMFGLNVIRHRIFEIEGFRVPQPEHVPHRGLCTGGHYFTAAGHGRISIKSYCNRHNLLTKRVIDVFQHALGINWISDKKTIVQSVPPRYSEFIGRSFLDPKSAIGVLKLPKNHQTFLCSFW